MRHDYSARQSNEALYLLALLITVKQQHLAYSKQ